MNKKNIMARYFLTSLIILLISAGKLYPQVANVPINYISETNYINQNATIIQTTYFDGLGRELQRTERMPNRKQVVSNTKYDVWGRVLRNYLPYESQAKSGFVYNAETEQQSYYQTEFNSVYSYSQMAYDRTTKADLIEKSLPGDSWRMGGGHTTRSKTSKNAAGDNVKKYSFYTDGVGVIYSGFYNEGKLIKTENIDPQGDKTYKYYDINNNLIAQETRTDNDTIRTYYLYDEVGLLRYIIPPTADKGFKINSPRNLRDLQRFCFYTEYDQRKRPYKTYVPGAGYTIKLYDKKDRLVLSQSENLRAQGKWIFTKYDEFNRPVIAGICGGTEASHTAALEVQTVFGETRNSSVHGYTDVTYPAGVNSDDILTVTYYDNYDWQGEVPGASAVAAKPEPTFPISKTEIVAGLVTGAKCKVIGIDQNKWLYSATYYDDKYNVIHSVNELYPSGIEAKYTSYDFVGNPTKTQILQTINNKQEGYARFFEYDQYARISQIKQKILGNINQPYIVIANYKYNGLSQIIEKTIHNDIDTTHYTYSIDGRLIAQQSPLFSYKLYFDKQPTEIPFGVKPRFDNNISAIIWDNGNPIKAYINTYDNNKQLSKAIYTQDMGGEWDLAMRFSEKNIKYDLNGNILKLQRSGKTPSLLHDINNTYEGNKLTKANINGNDYNYTYDGNGNMTYDGYKGINIVYNILNLPEKIFAGSDEVSYIYNSAGQKLATKVGSSFTYYRGDLVYNNDQLDHIINPEGITRKSSAGFVYYYAKRDHIGSTRVLCYENQGTMTSVQTTDYYPFGLTFYNSSTNYNRYLFSGKEIQDQTLNGKKLNLYDFGARNYDPTLGRWFNPDPALQFTNPYVYCANNPVNFIDPNGLAWKPIYSEEGVKGVCTGYEWIDETESYGADGSLKEGLYAQAIFFSDNGNFDPEKKYNIGSSTATVYLADGTTTTFAATTYPSNVEIYATVPEGAYEAIVGKHKNKYPALKMRDIGARYQRIELGGENPAYNDGRTFAEGINIHMDGLYNLTGMTSDNRPVSEGCLLIDRYDWDRFIGIFDTQEQRSNKVSVTVSRTLSEPIGKTLLPVHLGRDVQIINTFIY